MTPELYAELTGKTSDAFSVRKATAKLEALLGYTLDPEKVNENLYNELGKSQDECACPSVDRENLQDPDEVTNAYRLFRYDPKEPFLHVDPFTNLNSVKLVMGDVTIKTFDLDDLRVQSTNLGFSRFIEVCRTCHCVCDCKNCVQLAVDADWEFACDDSISDSSLGTCWPDDLLTVWVELVQYELDCKKNVRSETIGAHSYTKYDKTIPEEQDWVRSLLLKYVGPWGSLTKKVGP